MFFPDTTHYFSLGLAGLSMTFLHFSLLHVSIPGEVDASPEFNLIFYIT